MTEWAGKRVWVIGASTGIGQACAMALAQAGAQVVVSARKIDGFKGVANIYPIALDVTDAASVQAAKDAMVSRLLQHERLGGELDLVVYCAGHYHAQRATDFDLPEMLRHQEVNYVGALQV
jgi:NAD(P)-dependent dehydrogenase (short-subunit alcohol dehydrogenase family)